MPACNCTILSGTKGAVRNLSAPTGSSLTAPMLCIQRKSADITLIVFVFRNNATSSKMEVRTQVVTCRKRTYRLYMKALSENGVVSL